jgi:hypothetical protein
VDRYCPVTRLLESMPLARGTTELYDCVEEESWSLNMIPVHTIAGPLGTELIWDLVGVMTAAGARPHHSNVYVIAASPPGWAELTGDHFSRRNESSLNGMMDQSDLLLLPEPSMSKSPGHALLLVAQRDVNRVDETLAVIYGCDPYAIRISRSRHRRSDPEFLPFADWVRSVWENEG